MQADKLTQLRHELPMAFEDSTFSNVPAALTSGSACQDELAAQAAL
jgi:hypothetical protein